MTVGLLQLPHELLLNILKLLKRTDLKALRLVCQLLNPLTCPLLFSKLVTPSLESRTPFNESWVVKAESSVPWAYLRHVREIAFGVSTGQDGLSTYHIPVSTPALKRIDLAQKLRCIADILALIWARIDRASLVRVGALCRSSRSASPCLLGNFTPKLPSTYLCSLRSLDIICHPKYEFLSINPPIFSPWDLPRLEYIQWRGLFPRQNGEFQRLLMANRQTLRKVVIEMSPNDRAMPTGYLQNSRPAQHTLPFNKPTAFPALEGLSILGVAQYGTSSVIPGGSQAHGTVLENLRSLKLCDFAGSLYVSRLGADDDRERSKLELLELSYVRWSPAYPFGVFKSMAVSPVLRDCFISIWDAPLAERRDCGLGPHPHERWPALLESIQSAILQRLVLEGVSLRVRQKERLGESTQLSGMTTPDNVLNIPAVTNLIIKAEIECLGVSFDLREIHVFAAALHRIAPSSSNLKLLHIRWPGLLRKHAPNAWNSSSLFDWPSDCTWYRHINGFSASAETAVHIFNVPLIYSTDKIPHDLQKIVHWAFGPTGFPNLQVIAFGDFGTAEKAWRSSTALFCRNDSEEPWEVSHQVHAAGLSLNVHPNFRLVTQQDWRCQELVDQNMDFLTACPCKSVLEDAHGQPSMAALQKFDTRFQIVDDDDDDDDEHQVSGRHDEGPHLSPGHQPHLAGS